MNTEFITPVNLRNEMLENINKYNNSKIYKIVSASSDKIYIGSTTQSLQARLQNHIKDYKQYLVGKQHYITSYAIISLGDYSIQLISNHVLENKAQLFLLEGEQIRLYRDVCVNSDIPGRTKKEYYEDNKEHLLNKGVQYYLDNKETIKEKVKQYNLINKETIKQRDKQYYLDNKETISEYKKQYSIINKETIKQYKSKPYTCECGASIIIQVISKHQRTPKHFTNINKNLLDELPNL
jgi:hypothetical protein